MPTGSFDTGGAMPFNQFVPRPLNLTAVQAYAPAASGVYGISNANQWLYIGDTDNLQSSLMAHLQEEQDTPLKKLRPTGFVFELCDYAGRPGRRHRLVQEYGPACNGQPARQTSRSRLL
jgi:hypothetical protein